MTMIVMASSYIVFMLPLSFYCVTFTESLSDPCCNYYPQQLFLDVGISLQILEHVIHMLFLLLLNCKFRKEVRIFLHLEDGASNSQTHELGLNNVTESQTNQHTTSSTDKIL